MKELIKYTLSDNIMRSNFFTLKEIKIDYYKSVNRTKHNFPFEFDVLNFVIRERFGFDAWVEWRFALLRQEINEIIKKRLNQ